LTRSCARPAWPATFAAGTGSAIALRPCAFAARAAGAITSASPLSAAESTSHIAAAKPAARCAEKALPTAALAHGRSAGEIRIGRRRGHHHAQLIECFVLLSRQFVELNQLQLNRPLDRFALDFRQRLLEILDRRVAVSPAKHVG